MRSLPTELSQSLRIAASMRPRSAEEIQQERHGRRQDTVVPARTHWLRNLIDSSLADQGGAQVESSARTDAGPSLNNPAGDTRVRAIEALDMLLEDRHSDMSAGPATVALAFSALHAVGSARALRFDSAGRLWQSRRHPSAGGTHSLEPLLHAVDVDGLESAWYCQSGTTKGDVTRVSVKDACALSTATGDALSRDVKPAAVLYAICDPILLGERYPRGSSLLWRDAGAFTMTIHLLAHAHGLTSTILGVCVPLDVEGLAAGAENAPGGAYAVGAVAIGGPHTREAVE